MTVETYSVKGAVNLFKQLAHEYDYGVERARNHLIWRLYYGGGAKAYCVKDVGRPILLAVVRPSNRKSEFLVSGSLEGARNDLYYKRGEDILKLREAFDALLRRFFEDGCRVLIWSFLKSESPFAAFLSDLGAEQAGGRPNIRIRFGGVTHEEYFARLGKHAKQNVRTAYNRCNRDGKKIEFTLYTATGMYGRMSKGCAYRRARKAAMNLYLKRHKERYGIKGLRHVIATHARWAIEGKWDFLGVLAFNGVPVAFSSGPIILHKKEFWGTRLAIDSAASFYSPGMILVNEMVKFMIENTDCRCFNLGRGTEKYKYDMGGMEDFTSDWRLPLQH